MNTNGELVRHLIATGVLTSTRIESAFVAVDRKDFVPTELLKEAYYDEALPIGRGQTISQPYTVAFMLEQLAVEEGDVVLDVGSGSGWQSTLLAHLVGKRGRVHAIELLTELCEKGKANLAQYPELAARVDMQCGNAGTIATKVLSQYEHIDRIITAASMRSGVPPLWLSKLRVGGVFIYPSGSRIFKLTKTKDGFETEEFSGFAFVPFVERGIRGESPTS